MEACGQRFQHDRRSRGRLELRYVEGFGGIINFLNELFNISFKEGFVAEPPKIKLNRVHLGNSDPTRTTTIVPQVKSRLKPR